MVGIQAVSLISDWGQGISCVTLRLRYSTGASQLNVWYRLEPGTVLGLEGPQLVSVDFYALTCMLQSPADVCGQGWSGHLLIQASVIPANEAGLQGLGSYF